jgi:hypothetical protein
MTDISPPAARPWRLPRPWGGRRQAGYTAVAAVLALLAVLGIRALDGAHAQAARATALAAAGQSYAGLSRTLDGVNRQLASCPAATAPAACRGRAETQLGGAYLAFATAIRAIGAPAGSPATAAGQLAEAATQTGLAFRQLGQAATAARYRYLAAGLPTEEDQLQVQNSYGYLRFTLQGYQAQAGP